jgi:hypothetical protein
MKTIIRRLARRRHAVYATLGQSVIAVLLGLYFQTQGIHEMQDNPLMTPRTVIGLGIAGIRLAKTFEWLTRAFQIRPRDLDEYALMIAPVPPRQDQEITGDRIPYIPDDWPDLRNRSFLWIPVAYDPKEETYAWQRT